MKIGVGICILIECFDIFVVAFGLGFIGLIFSIPLKMAINRKRKENDLRKIQKGIVNDGGKANIISYSTVNTNDQKLNQTLDEPLLSVTAQ